MVADYEVGAAEHSCVPSDNDAKSRIDYLKVGKVMHKMLTQNAVPQIVGIVTTATKIKLLFMIYDAGYVSFLRTKSFKISMFYMQDYMQILKNIFTNI